jgi:hypothetical protein
MKLAVAVLTFTLVALKPVLAPAVCVERGSAIRAHDSQVLEAVVVGYSVDVIEDQSHPATSPKLILAAHLASAHLESLLE